MTTLYARAQAAAERKQKEEERFNLELYVKARDTLRERLHAKFEYTGLTDEDFFHSTATRAAGYLDESSGVCFSMGYHDSQPAVLVRGASDWERCTDLAELYSLMQAQALDQPEPEPVAPWYKRLWDALRGDCDHSSPLRWH